MSAVENQESLMEEYQATQEMVRHYDDIMIRFASMSQAGVLIFIGLAFGFLSKDQTIFFYLFPFVIVFVAMTNLVVHMWFKRHRAIAQIKIRRLLELENKLGWQQFSLVNDAIKSKKVESKPVRNMLVLYHLSLPILLVVAYVVILEGRNYMCWTTITTTIAAFLTPVIGIATVFIAYQQWRTNHKDSRDQREAIKA